MINFSSRVPYNQNEKYNRMKINIYLFSLIITLFSCNSFHQKDTVYLAELRNTNPNISITTLLLDSFYLEQVESSYIGFLSMSPDSIFLIDKKICTVFIFDTEGKFCKKRLGMGQGPKEITAGNIDGYSLIAPNSHLFLGPSNDCHLFNNNFQIQKQFFIDKGKKEESNAYAAPWIYTLCYENLIIKNYGNYLYYNVFSEHKSLNFIDSPKNYFDNAHYLSKLNLETGKIEEMLGKFPEIYIRDKGLKQYSFVNFDISNEGRFSISFEADSLIYEYDKNFTPICSYGYSGRNLQIKSKVLSTFREFSENYNKCRNESGFYRSLKYIDETDLLFRTYKRATQSEYDGMQIYKDRVLIGDFDVPEAFKILGYVAPYYYATTGIDEENETILLYKFTVGL